MSVENIQIDGTGFFVNSSENAGTITQGVFDDTSINSGLVTTTAIFEGNAVNSGTVVLSATFLDSTSNTGTVAEVAIFAGASVNTGIVSGAATFTDTASNYFGSVLGQTVFSGNSINYGTIAGGAIFLGSSQNGGMVTGDATFADEAGNLSMGRVRADAIFVGNSVNAGTVDGDAYIASTANGTQGNAYNQIVYIQPDGYFAYGHYIGGSKTAPANYATVVHQVDYGFWYKYDASGNASLASGNYDDGTSDTYAFANGIKGDLIGQGGNTETAADAWGLTHDGQYESSGRWYLDGSYVGDETAFSGLLQTAADTWAASNYGEYITNNGYHSNLWYIGEVTSSGVNFYQISPEAYSLLMSDINDWLANGGEGNYRVINVAITSYTPTGNPFNSNLWYLEGQYIGQYDTGMAIYADHWGSANNGEFRYGDPNDFGGFINSGRWYLNGEYLFSVADQAGWNAIYNGVIDDAAATAGTNGQYESSGRWYKDGSLITGSGIININGVLHSFTDGVHQGLYDDTFINYNSETTPWSFTTLNDAGVFYQDGVPFTGSIDTNVVIWSRVSSDEYQNDIFGYIHNYIRSAALPRVTAANFVDGKLDGVQVGHQYAEVEEGIVAGIAQWYVNGVDQGVLTTGSFTRGGLTLYIRDNSTVQY